MSSIRMFLLGALQERGPMHGHQLRLLAEQEHVALWTDITVGSLYGALKRLAAEALIEEERTEQKGSYPRRQVWAITEAGREALVGLRLRGLREIVVKPDPFDLALSRLDPEHIDDLPAIVEARIKSLSAMLADHEAHASSIQRYLTPTETTVMAHRTHRLNAEVAWHTELSEALPGLISAESRRPRTRPHPQPTNTGSESP